MSASRASRNAQCVSFAICASNPIRHQHRHRQQNDVYTQNSEQQRRVFVESWRKYRANEALEPLEQLIVQAIHAHPEYHALFDWPDKLLDKDYTPVLGQSYPFLHLGLHIAVQEQVATDRLVCICALYQRLAARLDDAHAADHRIAECMAETLWSAQRAGAAPNEAAYLACVRKQA